MCKAILQRGLVAALLLVVAFGAAGAQEFRGSITGGVTDPNGAVLPGATVTLKNVETSVETNTTTNDEGAYSFPLVQPGKYTLTATAQGFGTVTQENVEVRVADKLTLDMQVQVAGVGESVTTTASTGPALETGSVSTGSTITTQQLAELPLTDGTAYQLATLAPGVSFTGNPNVGGSPTSNGNLAAFRANGGTGANNVTLDGSPNYAFDGGVGFSPPSEAVQEFKVQTSQFDAQQGYSANANVNVALKSGGNDLHGALWYFNRDRSRTANQFFANMTGQGRAVRTYNRYGGVANGPVYIPKLYDGRNRTFFLVSYERLHNSEGGDAQFYTVPTAAMRSGNFSELLAQPIPIRIFDPSSGCHAPANCAVTRTPFTNNVIPTGQINPAAAAILNLYPLPNVAGAGLTNNYYSAAVRSSKYRGWLGRIDHQISQNHRVYANYYHSFNPEDRYNWAGTVNGFNPTAGIEFRTNDGGNVGYTATLTNSTVFDLKTSLNRFMQERRPQETFDLAQLGFSPQYVAAARGYSYLPRIDIYTYDQQRPVRSTLGSNRADYNEGLIRPFYTFSAQPTLTHITGNHTLRSGYDLRVLRENFSTSGYQGGRFFFDGTYTTQGTTTTTGTVTNANRDTNRQAYGRDVAAFLLGVPVASGSSIDTSATNYSVQSVYHGFFVHDDFRVTPKLTLNMGLRYELEMGTTERFNRLVNGFDPFTPSPVEAQARAAYTAAYNANPSNFPVSPEQFRVPGGVTFANAERRAGWNADKRNWQPRVGAAYQLDDKTVLRGGFGIFMAPFRIEQPTQYGFSASTPFNPTTDQGRTFVASLSNPFPGGLTAAPGASLGLLTRFGQEVGASDAPIIPYNRMNAKFNRMIVGVQRELPGQFVVEANYVWSRGYNMAVTRNINFVPRQFMGTDPASAEAANTFLSATTNVTNPFRNLLNNTAASTSTFNSNATLSRAQLLLPFPQFTNVWVQEYNGTNQYNALQLQGSKRFSRDLTLNATYTRSRLRERLSYLNASDPEMEDRLSPDDRPNRYTLAASYRLPVGRDRLVGGDMPRVLDWVIGGWQLNGTYEWQSGQPFNFTQNIYYAGDPSTIEARTFEDDGNGHKYGVFECANTAFCTNLPVFPTAGFTRLNSFGLRNFGTTHDNLRNMPYQAVNLSLTKNFDIREGKRLQLRAEALNAFNTPYVIDFQLDPQNARFGFSGGVQRNLPRDIQLGAKFTF